MPRRSAPTTTSVTPTTNLFAAWNARTGEVFGGCRAVRDGANFLAFFKKAVHPHAGTEIHVVLDNLSTHTTPEVQDGWKRTRTYTSTSHRSDRPGSIRSKPGSASSRQSIRRGTFTSVQVLIRQIRDYITHWNTDPTPFVWTAAADEILAKVRLVQTNIKKLVDNNGR